MPSFGTNGLLAGLCAAALLAAGGADAAVVTGTFEAKITSGSAFGVFGFDALTDLTGEKILGAFSYDTAVLGPNCPVGTFFSGCFMGTGGVTISHTINGNTVVFPGAAP